MSRGQKAALFLTLGLLVLAAAGIGVYQLRDVAVPIETLTMNVTRTGCRDATGACEARHPALGTLRLQFPQGAYYMQPFEAQLAIPDGRSVEVVILDLSMPGMNMGQNRFELKPVAVDQWRGKLLLPICVTGRVDWRLTLQVIDDGKRYQAEFPLELQAPPDSPG